MLKVARVAVDKTTYAFDRLFTYLIPDALSEVVCPGVRVLVPFGRANQRKQAMVFEVDEEAVTEEAYKKILSAIDQTPVLSGELLTVARYMASHTFCTYFDAIRAILPNGLNYRVVPKYAIAMPLDEIDFSALSDAELDFIHFLHSTHNAAKLNSVLEDTTDRERKRMLDRLEKKGIIRKNTDLKRRVSDKTMRMVRLTEDGLAAEKRLSRKQAEVVRLLRDIETAEVKEICYFCGLTEIVIKNLAKMGVVEYYDREVLRTPHSDASPTAPAEEIKLNAEQLNIYNGLCALLDRQEACVALLHGVTGSGKTYVFLKLIQKVLQSGKQVVMLVPEISLTPQTLKIFQNAFGKQVAVLHSSLSLGEQLDEWKRIKSGAANIVVGTRSAVFAPFERLGLLILDEEGEQSYKSESTPRYHAREIAKLRCVQNNCLLLLASATPSLESYYHAKTGTYKLFSLSGRYNTARLPETVIVDLKQEPDKGAHALSTRLLEELNVNLQRGEQSLLLLNRRGFHTHAQCVECGEVICCPHCSVAMTYHKANGYMMCHYCGFSKKPDALCPNCGGKHIRLSGLGTQRLEEELRDTFPKARILRMDADTTYSRYAYEKKFASFGAGEYDIMLGTQMIAKGLDFPNVTLTGVILADQTLYSGDYRCGEKTFSLLTQVVGRSGRGDKLGRAVIQTYTPDSPVIHFAARQDYLSFYEEEIAARRALLYPPYCDLCLFSVSGADERRVRTAANTLAQIIVSSAKQESFHQPLKLLGPTQAGIYKMHNKYRYRLILKCRMNTETRRFVKFILNGIQNRPDFQALSVFADVNGEIGI